MPDPVIGGALSSIGSVGSAVISSITGHNRQQEMLEYNSPVNQVKRLRKAGINPAFALEQGALDAGNASSPAPPMPQFDMNSLAQGIRDAQQLKIQKDLTDSEIRQNDANSYAQEMANKFALSRNLLELWNLRAQAQEGSKQAELLDKEISLRQKDLDSYDRRIQASVGKQEAESHYLEAQSAWQNIINQFEPNKQKALIDQINANSEELRSAARAHDADAAYKSAEKAVSEARKQGLDIANDQADALVDIIVEKEFSEMNKSFYDSGSAAKFYFGGEVGKRMPLSGFTDKESYNRHVNPNSRVIPSVPRKYRQR